MIKSVKDLNVYNSAFSLANEVFELSKKFPREETYSLTDQIRRSSRSVAINIREGFAKKKYENIFIRHLNDSLGSAEETRGWLEFARKCSYITEPDCARLDAEYDRINAMLYNLMTNWTTKETTKKSAAQKTRLPDRSNRSSVISPLSSEEP